jgi:hypothetical protein
VAEYVLPEALPDNIFEGKSACERSKYQQFLNYLFTHRGKAVSGWIPVSSKWLKRVAGGGYKRIVRFLVGKGIIEENPKCSSKSYSPKFKKRFCKSYRFTWRYTGCDSKIVREEFTPKARPIINEADLNDPIAKTIAQNYQRLSLDLDQISSLKFDDQQEARVLASKLAAGASNAHKGGKVGRYYHSILSANKTVRPLVRKDGAPLHSYDLRAAFPTLILAAAKPHITAEEFVRYADLIEHRDIYSEFTSEASKAYEFKTNKWKYGREAGKLMIQKFFFEENHAILKSGSSNNLAANFYKNSFSGINAYVLSQDGSSLSCALQNLEASLFCEYLMPVAESKGLWLLPMHDGFESEDFETGEMFKSLLETEFMRRYEFRPEIVYKNQAILGPLQAGEPRRWISAGVGAS